MAPAWGPRQTINYINQISLDIFYVVFLHEKFKNSSEKVLKLHKIFLPLFLGT